jgi:DNA-binding MarR family transcriptional regulator
MGFRTPLELKKFQEQHGTNDVVDNMLTLLADGYERPTLRFISECMQANVASPGTAHKYLQELRSKGYVNEITTKDARMRLVSLSEAGRKYLSAWINGATNDVGHADDDARE